MITYLYKLSDEFSELVRTLFIAYLTELDAISLCVFIAFRKK